MSPCDEPTTPRLRKSCIILPHFVPLCGRDAFEGEAPRRGPTASHRRNVYGLEILRNDT